MNTITANNQYQPRVAAFSDTGFVAAWASQNQGGSGKGVYGRLLSATGAKLNIEFRINTTALHDQWQPAVATLAGPSFVVAWTSPTRTAPPASTSSASACTGDLFGGNP